MRSVLSTSSRRLDLLPNDAEHRVESAAEEQQSGYGQDRDKRKDECVFRETLSFLAVKDE